MKRTYRQSSNIEDLQDKPQRPGTNPKPTKAKKRHETKAKLIKNAYASEITTSKKSLKDIPSTELTTLGNRLVNYFREGSHGHKLGLKLKNKKLDIPESMKKLKKTQPMAKKDYKK